jgi:hypothetical protein
VILKHGDYLLCIHNSYYENVLKIDKIYIFNYEYKGGYIIIGSECIFHRNRFLKLDKITDFDRVIHEL